MSDQSGKQFKKAHTKNQSNPLEMLKDLGASYKDNPASSYKQIDSGKYDQYFGNFDTDSYGETDYTKPVDKRGKLPQRKEFTLFRYTEHYETKIVKDQINQLSEAIRKEIKMMKKADNSLMQDIADIEKIALQETPVNAGIYHVRFLEIVLNLIRTIRAKIGESRTWLQAMTSKRKKRGSLFAALSKKKGTQYSLSQELSSARSVQ